MAKYCDKTLFNWIKKKNPLWVNDVCCAVRFQCDFTAVQPEEGHAAMWIVLTEHSNPLCIVTNPHPLHTTAGACFQHWVLNNSVKFLRNRECFA